MAAFVGVAQIAEEALAAATAETVVQIVAPANHRVKVLAWGVYFDGVAPTAAPVQVTLSRQSTAGTSSALTNVKWDDSIAETLQTTALQDFSVEPTTGAAIASVEVHPQGSYECVYPLGGEPICGGGDRIGIVCTAPAIVNVRAFIRFEE